MGIIRKTLSPSFKKGCSLAARRGTQPPKMGALNKDAGEESVTFTYEEDFGTYECGGCGAVFTEFDVVDPQEGDTDAIFCCPNCGGVRSALITPANGGKMRPVPQARVSQLNAVKVETMRASLSQRRGL